MANEEKSLNLETIDQALLRSTNELEKLASVYRHHGFDLESDEILGTITRIREHIKSEEKNSPRH